MIIAKANRYGFFIGAINASLYGINYYIEGVYFSMCVALRGSVVWTRKLAKKDGNRGVASNNFRRKIHMNYRLSAFADEASSQLSGQIAALKRNGIPHLEIRGVNGKNIKDVTVPEAKEIKKALDDEGISVFSMGSPIGKIALNGDLDGHYDDHKRLLELTDIFEAKRIRMFSFYPVADWSAEKNREESLKGLDKLLSLTPDHVILCHENEKDIYGEQYEACVDILREFPKMKAIFDPANFVQAGVDTKIAWEALKDRVEYLHIKDAAADRTVVPAGKGLGNIPFIVKDYLARGGEVMTLEPHLSAFTGLAGLENGISIKHGVSNYKNTDESFDAAASALREILANI